MQYRNRRQRGASFWQLLVIAIVAGFFVLLALKLVPVYLNELKVATSVKQVTQKSDLGTNPSMHAIRRSLARHWDIDNIHYVTPKDIDVQRNGDSGTTLSWDYQARVHLFFNIDVVVTFTGAQPLGGKLD